MKLFRLSAILLLSIFTGIGASVAQADTLVLIQGYQGNAGSWRESGITKVLQLDGWQDAGHLYTTPKGAAKWSAGKVNGDKFYTIDLPSEAPIPLQAQYLTAYVKLISAGIDEKAEGDKLILAGHSAGGVVARTMMVTNPELKISKLITIASPNRGTELAETGLAVANSPVGFFAPMMGADSLTRSRNLYRDLVRERPGTFLHWLNTRKHPEARYIAIVRASMNGTVGDDVVPGWSQPMQGIAGLEKHDVKTFVAPGPHELTIADGATLLSVVGNRS